MLPDTDVDGLIDAASFENPADPERVCVYFSDGIGEASDARGGHSPCCSPERASVGLADWYEAIGLYVLVTHPQV